MNKKKYMYIGIAVSLALFAIGTFYDLSVSLLFTRRTNEILVWLGDKLGYMIPTSVFCVGCTLLAKSFRERNRLVYVVWWILLVCVAFYGGYQLVVPEDSTSISKLIWFVFTIVLILNGQEMQKRLIADDNEILKIGYLFVLDVVFVLISVNLLKVLWGRERFLYMIDVQSFTPWYMMHPFRIEGDIYKSFPSAHAAFSTVLLTLCHYFNHTNISETHKKIIHASCWLIVIFVMTTRIFAGMHFLSDVIAGMALGYGVYRLTKYIVDRYLVF